VPNNGLRQGRIRGRLKQGTQRAVFAQASSIPGPFFSGHIKITKDVVEPVAPGPQEIPFALDSLLSLLALLATRKRLEAVHLGLHGTK